MTDKPNGYTGKIIPGVGYVRVPNPRKDSFMLVIFDMLKIPTWAVCLLALAGLIFMFSGYVSIR
jgi:hypothetical protein